MHPLRIFLALTLISACMTNCSADDLFQGISNESCIITLIKNGGYRLRYEGGPHPTLEISMRAFSKYIDLKPDETLWKGDYKITLFNGNITDDEAKVIFDSAIDTLRHFQFKNPGPVVMDGNGVTLTVGASGGNSMQVSIGPLADCKDASPGIANIIKIADTHDSKDWDWDNKLPPQISADIPRRNRKTAAATLAPLFHKDKKPPTVECLFTVLGRPDKFSKQFGASRTRGSTEIGNGGGTFLFLQDDGSEILAWTPDFKRILFVGRFGPNPDQEDVIYLAPYR